MGCKTIDLETILSQGPEAEKYVFTYRPEISGLVTSIREQGLLIPPVLKALGESRYQVVSGSRRVHALRLLGTDQVEALVLPPGEATDVACLRRSILENQWHRGFNEVEKALLFTGLHDEFPHLLASLEDVLGDGLKIPRNSQGIARYRFILSLPEPVIRGLAQGRISLAQAQILKRFPAEARLLFYRLEADCKLTLQESRQASEWILDTARADHVEPGELMKEEPLGPLPADDTPPRQRAQKLLSFLRSKRYPLLESWKERAASAISQTGVRDKGIRISHDPTFETSQVRIQIQAGSGADLKNQLVQLTEAMQAGRIEKIFQALSVD